jgi:hypothetical protein
LCGGKARQADPPAERLTPGAPSLKMAALQSMKRRTAALALLATVWPALASAQVPRGGEFQVNAYTTGNQGTASIASAANGAFTVVWTDYARDGSHSGIFGRRFGSAGTALGGDFQVNTYTTGFQSDPAVASDASGNVVVVWHSPQDAGTEGVYARAYDPAGNPTSGEFRVNANTTGLQLQPAVALGGDGSFTVVWADDQDGSLFGVSARRYDAAGIPGPELRVNTFTTGVQSHPAVAADAAGGFVVVWTSSVNQDGDDYGVFGRRYDATGAPIGGEFQVNSYTTSAQYGPSVAMASDGRFVVAWQSYGQDTHGFGIAARRFDAAGVAEGPDFVVNTFTTGYQRDARVAMDNAANFVIVWDSELADGSGLGVFGRRYEVSGVGDPEFRINTYTTATQWRGSVASAANGGFVVAWESDDQDGSGYGIFAQRMSPDLIFRDGFETGTLAAWSASATDGANLGPSAFGALNSTTIGLRGLVDDTNSLFVEDDTPHDENRYRARFYFDPNGFDPGEKQSHFRTRIFLALEEAPTRRLAAVVLKRQARAYSLMGRCRLEDGSQADTGFISISNAPHAVEIDWRRSTGPSANDGRFELFIDGASVSVLTNLDNGVSAIDFARLGALSVKTGATGTIFWDEFASRRQNYIGP